MVGGTLLSGMVGGSGFVYAAGEHRSVVGSCWLAVVGQRLEFGVWRLVVLHPLTKVGGWRLATASNLCGWLNVGGWWLVVGGCELVHLLAGCMSLCVVIDGEDAAPHATDCYCPCSGEATPLYCLPPHPAAACYCHHFPA